MTRTVLVVEDDIAQRFTIKALLQQHLGYYVLEAGDGYEALQYVQDPLCDIDLVLMDITMPRMGGREALKEIKIKMPDLPIIVLTASDEISDVIDVMRLGACDFMTKPAVVERLQVSINNALTLNLLNKEVLRLRRRDEGHIGFSDLVGGDTGLAESVALGRKGAASDISILITGESGVGKELFSRAIHGQSSREGKPFIAVNCGAIPENLVESTLFGHEKGAFTGAIAQSLGKFREADGGTLFLDEVGELKPDIQVKLLRALQQGEVDPVGAGKPVEVNVRIISATNRSLIIDVKEGRFREDLYYRLNVFPIHISPLRDRKQDIEKLMDYFLQKFRVTEHKDIRVITDVAMCWLQEYHWPGNVRELENAIFRAIVLCDGEELDIHHITGMQPSIMDKKIISKEDINDNIPSKISFMGMDGKLKSLDIVEYEAVQNALVHSGNNVMKAAKALGIGQSTLYRKLSLWQKSAKEA